MATGRVLQFDSARGYGFVAADDGGEDIFLHASVFDDDPDLLVPGAKVRFQVMAGDRGRKAFGAQLAADDLAAAEEPVRPLLAPPRPAPVPPVLPAQAPPPEATSGPLTAAPPVPLVPPVPEPAEPTAPDEEQMCDVLSPPQFRQEITELLLNEVPELAGRHILQARDSLLEFAKKHGWIDG